MQHLMCSKVLEGKTIRDGYLEEILEATNQILVSNQHIELLTKEDAKHYDILYNMSQSVHD